MLEWFRPRMAPEGPVTFDFDIRIARPAGEVYPLLDWGDERHLRRQLGDWIEPVGDDPMRYRLFLAAMPEHVFDVTLIDAVPGETYVFETHIEPTVGRLVANRERYTIESDGPDACELRLINEVIFDQPMSLRDYRDQLSMMASATSGALDKLRLLAEEGPEALRAFEASQFGDESI